MILFGCLVTPRIPGMTVIRFLFDMGNNIPSGTEKTVTYASLDLSIYAEGYIVFVFPFIRLRYVFSFIRSFVH